MTATDTEVQDVPTRRALNATDRCDRCGAQAYVATTHEGGTVFEVDQPGTLLWCAHHAREVPATDAITGSAIKVVTSEPVPA